MTNHYHIVVETVESNLSQGMRQLNGVYSQYFNHTHRRVGHVYQGRYKGILVDKDSYLLELTRYVVQDLTPSFSPTNGYQIGIFSQLPIYYQLLPNW